MPRRTRPRRGSLAFYPRKRAKRLVPRFRSWPKVEETVPLGFFGYKAGMTHVLVVDARPRTPTSGQPVFMPVTVIETPPLFVYGIRFYEEYDGARRTATEVWAENLPKEMARRVTIPEKVNHKDRLENVDPSKYVDVRLLVATQPKLTTIGKKTPDLGEIALGGADVTAKFEKAKELLGKEIRIADVFKPGELVDVKAVTKGKGFQGVVKRFGVFEFGHKKEKTKRGVGSIGPWHPAKVMWTIPRPGQMGFHTRTEYNKLVIMVSNPKEQPITPAGGFLHYGEVRNDYIVLAGSVPGPAKRIIGLRKAIRPPKHPFRFSEIKYISLTSKQGA